ncbi:MAG: glycosyltransferase family 4 protein [Chloroflexota bacterium]
MHIYYIIHYFPPELNGGATRASELARHWVEAGHQVTILTGFPNHPNGVIPHTYKGKFFHQEMVDGYRVRRTYIYATPNKGSAKRIINHTSLTLSTIIGSMIKSPPDVIIASSPPLFLGISGYILSKLKRVPYLFEVRDIWPQQAIDLGMLRNQKVIRLMEGLEFFLYRHASRVVGVTDSTDRILQERGLEAKKIVTIFNGTDLDTFQPGPPDESLKTKLGLQDKFVISYIGTMGLSQGLISVIDAATQLKDRYPELHFLLVGAGAERDLLIKASQDKGLDNVTFLEAQPRSQVPLLYNLSDVSLVVLKNLPLFHSTIPSKIFEIMACGTPLILGVAGEVQKIVEQADAGLCIEPENVSELSEAIIRLYEKPALRDSLSNNGRTYVDKHYNRKRLAEQYLTVLQDVVAETG